MTITIEQTTNADDVAELFDAYRQFYKQPSDKNASKSYLQERIASDEIIIFLAKKDELPAGFVNIYKTFSSVSMRKVWTFNDLFVHPSFRRHGIAKFLMEYAIDQAHENNVAHMQLETAQDNKTAQSLYEQTGWKKNEFLSYYLPIKEK